MPKFTVKLISGEKIAIVRRAAALAAARSKDAPSNFSFFCAFRAEGLDHAHRGQKFPGYAIEPVQAFLHGAEARIADLHIAPNQ